jgi:hypothetical protein
LKWHIELNRRRGPRGRVSSHPHPRSQRDAWRWRWAGAWSREAFKMDSHRRQQQQLLGEAAVNALCSNLPSRTSALLRTDCRHGNGMGCLPLPWPSRRVVSSPCLPLRTLCRCALCMVIALSACGCGDGRTSVCIACLDGNYRLPCACVMTPAPRRRPLR